MKHFSPLSTDYWDIENSFYLRCGNERLGKLLSHYEIYKKIDGLAGDVMELGVFKGASFVRWASFRNSVESDSARRLIGFDAFGEFPTTSESLQESLDFAKEHDSEAGLGISKKELTELLREKGIGNFQLHAGDVFDTLPAYLAENDHQKLALLHLDMDVYEPTLFAVEHLWDRLVTGGVMVVDDYSAVAGATRAVDEFFEKRGETAKHIVEKAAYYHVPVCFIKDH